MRNIFTSSRFAAAIIVLIAAAAFAIAIRGETPVGSFKGKIIAEENGNPIVADVYMFNDTQSFNARSESDGTFSLNRIPAGKYKLEVYARVHSIKPIDVTVQEGRAQEMEIELKPGAPSLELYVHQNMFTPKEKAQVTCQGFLDSSRINFKIYRINIDDFVRKSGLSLRSLLGVESYYDKSGIWRIRAAQLDGNPSAQQVMSFSEPISGRDSEGFFTQRVDIPRLTSGLYVVSTESAGIQQLGWLQVTRLGLITKNSGSDMVVFVADLKTGKPVPGASVGFYSKTGELTSGTTGADGIARGTIPADPNRDNERSIVARSGDSFAFVTLDSSRGRESNDLLYAYTDRPVYRPGHEVYLRGIMRKTVGDNYVPPKPEPVTLEVRGPRDTLVYHSTTTTDDFGSCSGNFKLNPEAPTGTYSITTITADSTRLDGATFQVSEYKKPEMTAKITFAKKRYVRGELVRATLSADYFFGAPVPNSQVTYSVRRSAYWLFEGEEYYEGYEDYGGYGEIIAEGTIRTDENGKAKIEFQAQWPEPDEDDSWDSDQQYIVDAYVTDKSGQNVNATGSVIATRGEFDVQIQPDNYVTSPGKAVKFNVTARDYENRPIRNRRIEVIAGREIWNDEDEMEFRRLAKRVVRTDSFGRASVSMKLRTQGNVVISAKAKDNHGNSISGTDSVWVYSGEGEDESGYRYGDLEIITDKKIYSPGDKAKVLINCSHTGPTALVSVEGSRIYDSFTVPLKSKTTAIEIPIKGNYKPNFYISVCFVRNKQMVSQEAGVRVALSEQALNVKIQSDKPKYLPGEQASYTLTATDSKGKPARAELSMGVVDEAVYSIARDYTTPILDFFYSQRDNLVSTRFSFPEIYLSDPDKAGGEFKGRVRTRFEDTAFWLPNIVTNANGRARVKFRMPDNLTTWRATVRGITTNTQCGQAQNTVITAKPLLVRLETPRFLVQKDSTTISVIVHNYTGERKQIRVDLGAKGVKLDGEYRQDVAVDNGGSERIDWKVRAQSPGNASFTAYATTKGAQDAMRVTIPVQPKAVLRESMTSGVFGNLSVKKISMQIRNDSMPESTRLTIRLAPSLASAMLSSLDYLASYPYGCVEQTTSAFLPDVILWRSMRQLGISNPGLEKKLPDMVSQGLLRLYRFQNDDGGWGWCEYDSPDPEMTAYVCYALIQARNTGIDVNADVLQSGINRLAQIANPKKIRNAERTYCQYVLALAGHDVSAALDKIYLRKKLDARSLAPMAMAYYRLGKTAAAKTVLSRMYGLAATEQGRMHWGSHDQFMENRNIEAIAFALQAILMIDPSNPRVPDIIKWLMDQRQGDSWVSTRDTAMVLYAMSDYLARSQELSPNYEAIVLVNGKQVDRIRFTKGSVFEPDREIVLTGRELGKGRNEIEIRKIGVGNLYYTTDLKQYLARKRFPAVVSDSDVTVARAYYNPPPRYWETRSAADLGSVVSSCDTGDMVLVRLVVTSKRYLGRLLLEDYLPAGFEAIDQGRVDYWDWHYWWVDQDVRDEKISFYLSDLKPGRHVVEYSIRAGAAGQYTALPTTLFAMYDPSVRATSTGGEFTIR